MVKHTRKDTATFKSIYGDSLILNMNTSKGCLKVSIRSKTNAFTQKNTVFVGSILCAIALLRSLLGITTCLIVIGVFIVLCILYESFLIIEEKLLIIKGLGCHISKGNWFGERTVFIPYEQNQNIFINEVIFRHKVMYLLTLLTKDRAKEENKHKLVPLFLNLLPRIDCLQIIYKNIKYLEGR